MKNIFRKCRRQGHHRNLRRRRRPYVSARLWKLERAQRRTRWQAICEFFGRVIGWADYLRRARR